MHKVERNPPLWISIHWVSLFLETIWTGGLYSSLRWIESPSQQLITSGGPQLEIGLSCTKLMSPDSWGPLAVQCWWRSEPIIVMQGIYLFPLFQVLFNCEIGYQTHTVDGSLVSLEVAKSWCDSLSFFPIEAIQEFINILCKWHLIL